MLWLYVRTLHIDSSLGFSSELKLEMRWNNNPGVRSSLKLNVDLNVDADEALDVDVVLIVVQYVELVLECGFKRWHPC